MRLRLACSRQYGGETKEAASRKVAQNAAELWKDGDVEILLEIFSEETIQHLLDKAKALKDKNAD